MLFLTFYIAFPYNLHCTNRFNERAIIFVLWPVLQTDKDNVTLQVIKLILEIYLLNHVVFSEWFHLSFLSGKAINDWKSLRLHRQLSDTEESSLMEIKTQWIVHKYTIKVQYYSMHFEFVNKQVKYY